MRSLFVRMTFRTFSRRAAGGASSSARTSRFTAMVARGVLSSCAALAEKRFCRSKDALTLSIIRLKERARRPISSCLSLISTRWDKSFPLISSIVSDSSSRGCNARPATSQAAAVPRIRTSISPAVPQRLKRFPASFIVKVTEASSISSTAAPDSVISLLPMNSCGRLRTKMRSAPNRKTHVRMTAAPAMTMADKRVSLMRRDIFFSIYPPFCQSDSLPRGYSV